MWPPLKRLSCRALSVSNYFCQLWHFKLLKEPCGVFHVMISLPWQGRCALFCVYFFGVGGLVSSLQRRYWLRHTFPAVSEWYRPSSRSAHCVFSYSRIIAPPVHTHGRMITVQPDNLIVAYSACRVNGPPVPGKKPCPFPPACVGNSTLSKSKKMQIYAQALQIDCVGKTAVWCFVEFMNNYIQISPLVLFYPSVFSINLIRNPSFCMEYENWARINAV